MADAPPPMPTDPRLFAGPTLIGCIIVFFLFGIFVIQCLSYIGGSPQGSKPWRYPHYLVALVFCMEVLSLSTILVAAWDQLVVNGSPTPWLWVPPPSAPATGVLNGLVGFVVQIFFAAKVWRLASKTYEKGFAFVISVLALTQLAASCTVTTYFAIQGRHYSIPMEKAIIVFLTSTVACDIVITISMIILLGRYKRQTAFSATKHLLRTLTRNTIENGLVTSICATVNVIVFFTRSKHDTTHIVFQYMVGRLYAIVLLTSLNRAQVSSSNHNTSRSRSNTGTMSGGNVPAHSQGMAIPLSHRNGMSHGRVQVHVHRTQDEDVSEPIDFKGSAIGWEQTAPVIREEKDPRVYHGQRV